MWSFIPRPAKNTVTHFIRPSPDLYGPFWVCVTLIFCIATMGNIADYLHSDGEGQHWRYDFRKVSISATSIFSYVLLLPLLLWLFLWWRKSQGEQLSIGLIEIVCLYGYSLAIYIPISVIWTIPFAWIQSNKFHLKFSQFGRIAEMYSTQFCYSLTREILVITLLLLLLPRF